MSPRSMMIGEPCSCTSQTSEDGNKDRRLDIFSFQGECRYLIQVPNHDPAWAWKDETREGEIYAGEEQAANHQNYRSASTGDAAEQTSHSL